jgi:hypothetical protein
MCQAQSPDFTVHELLFKLIPHIKVLSIKITEITCVYAEYLNPFSSGNGLVTLWRTLVQYPVTHNLSHLACSLPRQLRSDFSCLATARHQKSRLADTANPYAIHRNPIGYRVLS